MNDTKYCIKCQEHKDFDYFYKNSRYSDGYLSYCKDCHRDYGKEWGAKNKEKRLLIAKKYRVNNPERVKENARRLRLKDPEKFRAYQQKYINKDRQRYRKMRAEYQRLKRATDLNFCIAGRIRSRVKSALKGNYKKSMAIQLLGCSLEELRQYLMSKFIAGMTWEKFMKAEIHIDHIRPCATFNLSDPRQQEECFNYRNLQPLWAKDNFTKNKKYI